jgi:hypothetical protein
MNVEVACLIRKLVIESQVLTAVERLMISVV